MLSASFPSIEQRKIELKLLWSISWGTKLPSCFLNSIVFEHWNPIYCFRVALRTFAPNLKENLYVLLSPVSRLHWQAHGFVPHSPTVASSIRNCSGMRGLPTTHCVARLAVQNVSLLWLHLELGVRDSDIPFLQDCPFCQESMLGLAQAPCRK